MSTNTFTRLQKASSLHVPSPIDTLTSDKHRAKSSAISQTLEKLKISEEKYVQPSIYAKYPFHVDSNCTGEENVE